MEKAVSILACIHTFKYLLPHSCLSCSPRSCFEQSYIISSAVYKKPLGETPASQPSTQCNALRNATSRVIFLNQICVRNVRYQLKYAGTHYFGTNLLHNLSERNSGEIQGERLGRFLDEMIASHLNLATSVLFRLNNLTSPFRSIILFSVKCKGFLSTIDLPCNFKELS